MNFWRDFVDLWHEWTATDTDDENFFVNCDAQNDETAWYGSDEPFQAFVVGDEPITFNPATGLSMMVDNDSVDVAGNPYGCDLDDHHPWDDNHDGLTGGFDSDPW